MRINHDNLLEDLISVIIFSNTDKSPESVRGFYRLGNDTWTVWYIEAWTKWLQFCRHFHLNFLSYEPKSPIGCSMCVTSFFNHLTLGGRATSYGVNEVGHHWFRQWLVACSSPSNYLDQCWLIVNGTLKTNFNELKKNQIIKVSYQVTVCENVVCEILAILLGPQCPIKYGNARRNDCHIVD